MIRQSRSPLYRSFDSFIYTICILALSCSKITGPKKYGGFVYDVTTGRPIKDYEMEVAVAAGEVRVDTDDETGKFEFSTPLAADYSIKVVKGGYYDFTSTNQSESLLNNQNEDISKQVSYLYNVPLVPQAVKSPAITAKVLDEKKGTPVTTGFFRVVTIGVISGFLAGFYENGDHGARWWLPDGRALGGRISAKGEFTIKEGELLPGFLYKVFVFGMAGFRDRQHPFSIGTSDLNSVSMLDIRVSPYAVPGTPLLIGQSTTGPDPNNPSSVIALPIGSEGTITMTFDRDVQFYPHPNLRGKGSQELLSINQTTDNDGDGITTSTTLANEVVSSGAFSSNVAFSSSGNQVFIKLAPDSKLISGPIDEDDDLSYTLGGTANLLGNLYIRDASSAADQWVSLNNILGNPRNIAIIRANHP